MKTMSALILTTLLCSCGGSYWERQEQARNDEIIRLGDEAKQRDNNPNEYAYNQGAKHGYSSGLNTTGDWTSTFQKDVNMYVENKYYKAGWDDGFAKGKGLGDSVGRSIDNALRN